MSNENKKPVWVTIEAHEYLKAFCERTGRTQVDVVSELLRRFILPELEQAEEAKKG